MAVIESSLTYVQSDKDNVFVRNPAVWTVVGGFVALLAGVKLGSCFGHGSTPWKTWECPLTALVALLAVALPVWPVERNRVNQGRKAARGAQKRALIALAKSFRSSQTLHIRTCIMLADKSGQRRTVQGDTACNMENDPDSDLGMAFDAGVSGKAARQRKAVFGDLRYTPPPGAPDWGLRPNEQAKIRPTLQSILSAPLFDPDDPDGQILGTLQVDSDNTIDETHFDREESWELAESFADVISLLLVGSKPR